MERYSAYKNSGIDWIGEIPAGWDVRPLCRDFRIIAGATPKSGVAKYWNGNIPWITPADLGTMTIAKGNRFITQQGLDSCGTTLVPAGSVVVSNRAPIGQVAITAQSLCTNQGCKCLVPDGSINSSYAYYYLSYVTGPLNAYGQGTTFLELSRAALASFPCPVPKISEQQAIADYLDEKTGTIDAAVKDVERSIELLNEYRQSVISEAVTKGLDPTAPMKDSGIDWIGQIPQTWQVLPIKRCSSLSSGATPNRGESSYWDGDIPWVKTGELSGDYITSTAESITRLAITNTALQIYPKGTLLMAMYGQGKTRGTTGCLQIEATTNQACIAFTDLINIDHDYFWFVLKAIYEPIRTAALGSGQPNLNASLIGDFRIPVPPMPEQKGIAHQLVSKLTNLDSLIQQKQSLLVRLKEYRASLISECVTGKVKVPGVEE